MERGKRELWQDPFGTFIIYRIEEEKPINEENSANEEIKLPKNIFGECPSEIAEWLLDPALLYRIKCELDKDIIGEDKNKLLLFLICVSSFTKWPLSAIISGSSSAGKSWLMNNVLKHFPNVEEYTRITAAAPDRLGSDWTNRILKVEELRGTEKAQATLRVWISEGKLKLLTTEIGEDGKLTATTIETNGVPTFVTTVTDPDIDDELLNRLFILSIDESEEQTRQILRFEAKKYMFLGVENNEEKNELFESLFESLMFVNRVIIPYAELLAEKFPIPKGKELSVGPRRDFKKLLFLIGVSAWLHKAQRLIVQKGNNILERYVVASPVDFYIVWRICEDGLLQTLLKLTDRHKRVLEVFRDYEISLTVKDVAAELDVSESTARVYLNSLVRKGYLSKDTSEKTHRYSLKRKPDLDVSIQKCIISLADFEENKLEEWLTQQNYKVVYRPKGPMQYVDPLTGETFELSKLYEQEGPSRYNTILSKIMKKQDLSLKEVSAQENMLHSKNATFSEILPELRRRLQADFTEADFIVIVRQLGLSETEAKNLFVRLRDEGRLAVTPYGLWKWVKP